jgi:hypothetical protein
LGRVETIAKLGFTFSLILILTISGIGLYAQPSPINNMTKYTDPKGRLSINYPSNWTPLTSTNPFQQHVVQFINMVPFVSFNIVITPAAFGQKDPATVLNAYNLFPSTMGGYSISQNIECVKYNIDGNKACSIVLTRNGIIHSINIQVASYINKKMFIFTMQATPYDFNNYLPVFQNMLTSFKAPATSVNTTTLATKTATAIVNQTTIQKTHAPLLYDAGRSSNLNHFHNQSLTILPCLPRPQTWAK